VDARHKAGHDDRLYGDAMRTIPPALQAKLTTGATTL
jgi:hypothetical protein